MAFLDNSGDIILDAVLTDTGRMRLSKGDGTFKIANMLSLMTKLIIKNITKITPADPPILIQTFFKLLFWKLSQTTLPQ